MSVLVSVIIPTYNRRILLEEAVDSVLDQEIDRLQVVIVDDGSTDGTRGHVEVLLRGRWRGCGIDYIYQKNAGASAARNKGLQVASGQYVQFLDADDLLLPGKFQAQISSMVPQPSEASADVCLCLGLMGRGLPSASGPRDVVGTTEVAKLAVIESLVSRAVHVVPTNSPLWRREFLGQHAPWREDIGLGDDLEYHVRLLCSARRIVAIKGHGFFIRVHDEERMSTNSLTVAKVGSQFEARRSVYRQLQEAGMLTPFVRSQYSRATFSIYANAMSLGDPGLVQMVEDWLGDVVQGPHQRIVLFFVRMGRRVFGEQTVMRAHAYIQKISQGVKA